LGQSLFLYTEPPHSLKTDTTSHSKNHANFVRQKALKAMGKFIQKSLFFTLLVTLLLCNWHCLKSTRPGIPSAVQRVLNRAGINKPELLKAIGYYVEKKDSLPLKAMYGLIAQMDKNYAVFYSVQDTAGNHYTFDPTAYPDYLSLKHAWDSTEQIHGNLLYHADSFRVDSYTLSGDFLINNLQMALKAYRTFPWSRLYSFGTFCRWILPYRVANEQAEAFRSYFLKEYGPLPQRFLKKNTSPLDVAFYLNRLINRKMDYKDTYNKSLDVQSIRVLEKSGKGNFYDIAIYKVKVMRAFGIAAAMDYTPFLADTNFGYAFTTVILPGGNEMRMEYPHRVKNLDKPGRIAKLYRRTFYRDSASLFAVKNMHTSTPAFLGDFYYSDITNPLRSKTVGIRLTDTARYVYLSIFNDGGWHPVSWAIPKDSSALFQKMGKNIVYLPVAYQKHHLMRMGNPFLLDNSGIKHLLSPDISVRQRVTLLRTSPFTPMKAGEEYTLYFWDGNWETLAVFKAGEKGYTLSLPANALYLLSNDDIDFNERIFIINRQGKQEFY
jgi:hypothetical protein